MQLVIDIGNTRVKIGVFKSHDLFNKIEFDNNEIEKQVSSLKETFSFKRIIVSNVGIENQKVLSDLNRIAPTLLFHSQLKLPCQILYETPKTLGMDRLANACAVSTIFPNENVLSIDMGTCIKFDFVTKKSDYLGGSISPGVQMRVNAMHNQTAKLPKVDFKNSPSLVGTNTSSSLQSGIWWGVIKEIEGVIAEYSKQYSQLKVVLTGGDHIHFAKAFKNSIFARPNLTLEGLNEVLFINE